MCFGKKSSAPTQQTTPPPTPPTTFQYVGPDTSNTQQRMAAVNAATGDNQTAMSSFGSELGTAGTIPNAQGGMA